jgi:phenylpropionate dioxygenase-like ring-hydroxylating dioxygenase large terminal subunit
VDKTPTSPNSQRISPAPWIREHWYIACEAKRLKRDRPLSVVIGEVPLVLFRDEFNRAVALEDRCPHRSAPLSRGKICGGLIECCYHGWRFDAAGRCRYVPALAEGSRLPDESAKIPAHGVVEKEGFIWICPASEAPSCEPFSIPHFADAAFGRLYLGEIGIKASLLDCLENFLDVCHTRFIHGNLARVGPMIVRKSSNAVEIEYLDEPKPSGLLFRLFTPRAGKMRHTDRFLAPSVVQTEYDFGNGRKVLSNDIFTPITGQKCQLYSVTMFNMPLPKWLFRLLAKSFAKMIIRQDKEILEAVTENSCRFKRERRVIVDSDLFFPDVLRILLQKDSLMRGAGSEASNRILLM